MTTHATIDDDHTLAAEIVAETHAAGGLAPVDIERFWADQVRAIADPFAADASQVALGIRMGRECMFTELGVEPDWHRLHHDSEWVAGLAKRYNERAEAIVGRRVMDERVPAAGYRGIKELHELFDGRRVWNHESYWLMPSADTPDELESLLDRVERRLEDPRSFFLPEDWDEQRARLEPAGVAVPQYRGQRGPVTFAMSLFGVENLIFLIYDRPELAGRFRDLITGGMLARVELLAGEAGVQPRGFAFADDNCAMLSRELYEFFGAPILAAVFDRCSPEPGDRRYQHSDSEMAHLLPVLGELGLNGVNFGPRLSVAEIREHLPDAVIEGQLAPFTFSRDDEEGMVAECLRDCRQAQDARGLVFATAGSVNDGSRLTGLRLIMATVQRHGRYA